MSRKYKFRDNSKLYFVTFSVINWIDLFIRDMYRKILLESIQHCQKEKDLELYGWCIMTSHVHMVISTRGNDLSNIMRDLKRHTSQEIRKTIAGNNKESRKEWLIKMMHESANKTNYQAQFQLWQAESHPIQLNTQAIAWQKLSYLHYNPVEAGFVRDSKDWLYSSAIDYSGGKGLLEVLILDSIIF